MAKKNNYQPNEWNVIADLDSPGAITHIWLPFSKTATFLSRRVLFHCFGDDEMDPSVEASIGDFFGIPFGLDGEQIRQNNSRLVIAPANGLNCYFTMPFASRARIEIMPAEKVVPGEFYVQLNYCKFEKELPMELVDMRFHAQFCFENPCEQYGRNYCFLDATGKCFLVGATFGIEMRHPQPDHWYHGGGDLMLIDGSSKPSVIKGIGAEDFFGHSWSVEKLHSQYIITPYEEYDVEGSFKRITLYRFFECEPIFFSHSIRPSLGALGNAYSSLVYWYQQEPHCSFFRVPAADKRFPDSESVYGTYDIESDAAETWKHLAPFPCTLQEPFETLRAIEMKETRYEHFRFKPSGADRQTLPSRELMDVRWQLQRAYHHFVDFNVVARPAVYSICLQTEVVGYALRYIDSPSDQKIDIYFGFDDEAAVWLNDKKVFHGRHNDGFKSVVFTADLCKGKNRILIKLSNYDNNNFRFWGISFRRNGCVYKNIECS